jgi:8-oxo-dGTP pyrophosphatase MutT (NUDIX family)
MLWPVSVKGVVGWNDSVVLLHNERDEWELPGGRLEANETPEQAVQREVIEELGFTVEVIALLDTWVYTPLSDHLDKKLLIVTFGCSATKPDTLTHSHEHDEVGLFAVDELKGLRLPEGYRRSILSWRSNLV